MAVTQGSTPSERRLGAAQRWLFQRITEPFAAPSPDAACDARWVKSGTLPSSERIAVYRRAYFSRLAECLRDDYPALAFAVGSEQFEAICLEFIDAHPPASASLNFYGAAFADFCASWPAPLAVFWSELARLEWAVVECIHADAERSLDASELGAISGEEWSRARLISSPASRIIATSYPVHGYYRAFLAGDEPGPPEPEASTIAVSRRGDRVWRLGIDPPYSALLGRLARGEPLASALASMSAGADQGSGAAAELERVFSEWVACGLFAGVRVD